MKPSKKKIFDLLNIFISLVFVVCASSQTQPVLAQADESVSISGLLTTIILDSQTGASTAMYMLTSDNGQTTHLLIDAVLINSLGGLSSVNLKHVEVQGAWQTSTDTKPDTGMAEFLVKTIQLMGQKTTAQANDVSTAVTGSQPWITILCKFADYPDEPNTLSSYKDMYANTFPGLDHYWREVSYGTINLAGSDAVGWYTLPQSHAYYDIGGFINLATSREDCVHAADDDVDFSSFAGINLVFNASVGAGGISMLGPGYSATLDGVSKAWMIVWMPDEPSGYLPTFAHEMGHGFGLNHSSGQTGQTYDNEWDVMSQNWCWRPGSVHPTYGCLPQHTIAYYKNSLGWIPTSQTYTATNGEATITLEQLALPQTNHYKIAKIPIGGSSLHFYTVEARRQTGYDARLPGAAVIIHDVYDYGNGTPNARIIDVDGNGDTGDAGAMWTAGESFSDPVYGITITVNSATSTGFTVSIHIQNPSPTNITLSNARITENKPVGTLVGFLTAADPNSGDTHTFALQSGVAGCNSADNTSFQIIGNQLKSKVIFDYETKNSYNICIRTNDSTGGTFNKAFVIIATNVLDEIIKNGGFNTYPTNNPLIPTYWAQSNFAATDGKNTNTANIKDGLASIKMTNTITISKNLTQSLLTQTGLRGDAFVFSYWVKGSAIPVTAGVCQARVLFYNGTTLVGTKNLPCGLTGTFAYRYKTLSFVAPANYTKLVVQFTYSKASGTVWFDLVSLRK